MFDSFTKYFQKWETWRARSLVGTFHPLPTGLHQLSPSEELSKRAFQWIPGRVQLCHSELSVALCVNFPWCDLRTASFTLSLGHCESSWKPNSYGTQLQMIASINWNWVYRSEPQLSETWLVFIWIFKPDFSNRVFPMFNFLLLLWVWLQ